MIRRPPTSIELKLDDLVEYETVRREQEAKKHKKPSMPYNEPPAWTSGPKSKQVLQERIGYIPPSTNDRSSSPIY